MDFRHQGYWISNSKKCTYFFSKLSGYQIFQEYLSHLIDRYTPLLREVYLEDVLRIRSQVESDVKNKLLENAFNTYMEITEIS